MAEPSGPAGQADGERRERAIGRTRRTLIDQAAVEDELACVLRSRSVHGERKRVRREVLAEHALVAAVPVIGEVMKLTLKLLAQTSERANSRTCSR